MGDDMKKYIIIVGMGLLLILSLVFVNRDYKIEVDDGVIYGTLEHKSYDKIVLFISGSGPTDRDGNSEVLGGRNDSIKELSHMLNKNGVSTFAYDKRSSGKSVDGFNFDAVTFDDFVEDGTAVLEELRSLGYENFIIIGHSQGALIAEILGQSEDVKGVVSLCGTIRSIDEVLIQQFKQYDAETSEAAIKIIRQIKEEDYDLDIPESLEDFFTTRNIEFIYSWMVLNPMVYIEPISDKILLIYGDKDTQVSAEESEMIESRYNIVIIEDMNHVLKTVRSNQENKDSYINPIYKISPDLVDIILDFVL